MPSVVTQGVPQMTPRCPLIHQNAVPKALPMRPKSTLQIKSTSRHFSLKCLTSTFTQQRIPNSFFWIWFWNHLEATRSQHVFFSTRANAFLPTRFSHESHLVHIHLSASGFTFFFWILDFWISAVLMIISASFSCSVEQSITFIKGNASRGR